MKKAVPDVTVDDEEQLIKDVSNRLVSLLEERGRSA